MIVHLWPTNSAVSKVAAGQRCKRGRVASGAEAAHGEVDLAAGQGRGVGDAVEPTPLLTVAVAAVAAGLLGLGLQAERGGRVAERARAELAVRQGELFVLARSARLARRHRQTRPCPHDHC